MLTLREALTRATSQLSANPQLQPTALQDAVVLLMHTLSLPRAALIAHPERPVDREEQAAYQRLVERRLLFEPIQYIAGVTEFYGLTLRVTPAVLIPRPETELLVEAVLQAVARDTEMHIVDVGTGSGAIAIALANALPNATLTAVDLSAEALAVARENARTHGVEGRIRFVQSDLLRAVGTQDFPGCIVSNPPYVATADGPGLHPQVRDHEPAGALFSGPSGMEIFERLIPEARALLRPGGLLALEIGYGQRDRVADLLAGWDGVRFLDDLQGIARVALARRV